MNLLKHNKEILVLTLLVKNEADIIIDNIFYHYAQGVDFIIVTDNGSTDGTLELLVALDKAGVVKLLERGPEYYQEKYVNEMGRLAKDKYGATILIHSDGDEFWTSLNGKNLKTTFTKSKQEALSVYWQHVLPTPAYIDQIFPQAEMNVVTKPIISDDLEKETINKSIFVFKYPPKVIFSIKNSFHEVMKGNHMLIDGTDSPDTNSIFIYHFAFRSSEQFKKKVITAGKAFEVIKTAPKTAWYHKRWYQAYKKGKIAQEIAILIPELSTVEGIEYRQFDYAQQILMPILSDRRLKKKYNRYKNILRATDGYEKGK